MFSYHQEQHLRPKPNEFGKAIRRGIWIHAALEAVEKGKPVEPVIHRLMRWSADHGVDTEQANEVANEAAFIVAGHQYYWAANGEKIRPLGLEERVEVQLGDTLLSATMDKIGVIDEGPRRGNWLVEYKSTAEIPGPEWRAVDPQTAIQYIVTTQGKKLPIRGIVFDYLVTKKASVPTIRKDGRFSDVVKRTTTYAFLQAARDAMAKNVLPPTALRLHLEEKAAEIVDDGYYYQRIYVERPDEFMIETMRDVAAKADDIRQARKRGYFPRSFNKMCFNPMTKCFYGPVCVAEYTTGKESVIREARYEHDDGSREGRFDDETGTAAFELEGG